MPREKPAESSERLLGEFLLRACHDLKTPVRTIRTSAEILRREGLSEGQPTTEKHLGFIVDAAKKIDSLANALTSYSLAAQIEESSFAPVSLDVVVRAALARLDTEIRRQDARVAADKLPRVAGNSDRLAQLFDLLLGNALRHRSEQTPQIRITAEKKSDQWLIGVQDNGVGIEAAWLDRIFMPFVRLRSTSEGTGLSLAICRIIVERHGGRLWVQSTPGQGSTFFFTLPAAGEG